MSLISNSRPNNNQYLSEHVSTEVCSEYNTPDCCEVTWTCIHESFTEHNEVKDMINQLKSILDIPQQKFDGDYQQFENNYQRMKIILDQYIEQPHLIDPYLDDFIEGIVYIVFSPAQCCDIKHMAFKFLHLIMSARGYKVVIQHLPHEATYLEKVLQLLEEQEPRDTLNWQTRYCLLLWLSIIIFLPFRMSVLDSGHHKKTVSDRLLEVGQRYLMVADSCRIASAIVLCRFIIRDDIKKERLEPFLNWLLEKVVDAGIGNRAWERFGPLGCIAAILKHAKREDVLHISPKILKFMMDLKLSQDQYTLSSKIYIKIISRTGMVLLKPQVASWRYQRGGRSLAINLANYHQPKHKAAGDFISLSTVTNEEQEEDDDLAPEIEDIINELISGLKHDSCITRWSAAKGIGRLVSRLNKSNGDEVVCFVISVLDYINSEAAWHGACLALAELVKRGLLLPDRLVKIIPYMSKALVYEQPRGFSSVGSMVRDAACYFCWATARAYESEILLPFVSQISKTLLAIACFDREINCRRAASAAFQESVGRLGNFPNGIEIHNTADYFAVGIRKQAYLKISVFIAQFEEYTTCLIDHLLEYKVNNWDSTIRELTAKTLFSLTPLAPQYMASHSLNCLLANTLTIDLFATHGCILAIGEIMLALSMIDNVLIEPMIVDEIKALVAKLREKNMFVGISGTKTCIASLLFIENCSRAKLPFHGQTVINDWQWLIDDCLRHEVMEVREAAAGALTQVCMQYYTKDTPEMTELRSDIVKKYTGMLVTDSIVQRTGFATALGALPVHMLKGQLSAVVQQLIMCSEKAEATVQWAEARAGSLKALSNICITTHINQQDTDSCYLFVISILETFVKSLSDYTSDNRGDIGAWVREAAMLAIKDVLMLVVDEASELLTPDLITKIFAEVAQQGVEKIDRTRGIAGRVFTSLLYKKGKLVPFIPEVDKLRKIFSDKSSEIDWSRAQDSFPLFIQILPIPQFTFNLLLGLVSSVGGMTDSLARYASQALFSHLRLQPIEMLVTLSNILLDLFQKYQHDDRVTVALLNFTERLLTSNCMAAVIQDPQSAFALKLFYFGKAELVKSTNTKKLTAGINFFCQLVQVKGEVSRRTLGHLCILLCHRFLWLRRVVATQLYEAFTVYGEEIGYDADTLEEVQQMLVETNWSETNMEAVRAKRNKLCSLLNIPIPRPVGTTLGQ